MKIDEAQNLEYDALEEIKLFQQMNLKRVISLV